MAIPKVFISYSHDSPEHKKWVLNLATKLRNNGIDAIIDQWELEPGGDIPSFMEKHVKNSDYVLIVCTEEYVKKANSGEGGVGYEKMIITSDLIKKIDSRKVIPLIRQNGTRNVPTFIQTKLFLDFSRANQFEFSFDELVRTIHNAPLSPKPKVGNNPFPQGEETAPKKSDNALKELMKKVVRDFESGENYTNYGNGLDHLNISRIMYDVLINEAVSNQLIRRDSDGDLRLTPKGKIYAVGNDLIKK